jgi:uncharacterized protein involved in exopolysaccharide biosynthesis
MHRALRPLRFLRDRLLRANPRLALVAGLGVFSATAACTFTRPKIYEATASFIQTRQPAVIHEDALVCGDGINTTVFVLQSSFMARRVAERLNDRDVARLIPQGRGPDSKALIGFLAAGRRAKASALSNGIDISFRHPDPSTAAQLASLFAEEMRTWAQLVEREDYDRTLEYHERQIAELRKEAPAPESSLAANGLALDRDSLGKHLDRHRRLSANPPKPHTVIPAVPPAPGDYVFPNLPRQLAAGLLAGFVLGPTSAAFAARAKTRRLPVPAA